MTADKKEAGFLLLWLLGLVAVYVLFFPIKNDQFFHFLPVYGYLLSSVLLVWALYLISKPYSLAFATRLALIVLLTAVLFPTGSYLYNGKGHIIRNAAEYNYPLILKMFLNESSQEELDAALYYAKSGNNTEIIEYLKAKGAK